MGSHFLGALRTRRSRMVTLKLTPLITPEEVDAASRKHPSYRPPGQ
jgi:hypothetical protein